MRSFIIFARKIRDIWNLLKLHLRFFSEPFTRRLLELLVINSELFISTNPRATLSADNLLRGVFFARIPARHLFAFIGALSKTPRRNEQWETFRLKKIIFRNEPPNRAL